MAELRAALERAVELGEQSVQVAAYLDGELIVDASIGDAPHDAVYPVFSISKAVTALALHVQAERGLVDYDAPLADYWPRYAAHGKDQITVGQVLAHRAGVPQMPEGMTPEQLGDWDAMTTALEAIVPLAPPGTTNTYLSMTFGWLLGEVVRRTDPAGRGFADFVREELCEPLGVDAFWFGIPPEARRRVVELVFPKRPAPPPLGSPADAALPRPVGLVPEVFNRTDVQRAVIPAVGGIGDARSVARLFAVLANGGEHLLSPERVRGFLVPRPGFDERDATYGRRMPMGAGGFWLEALGVTPDGGLGRVLAHPGAGGTIAWAEVDSHLAVAICHDRMFGPLTGEHPFAAIADAVRAIARSRGATPVVDGDATG